MNIPNIPKYTKGLFFALLLLFGFFSLYPLLSYQPFLAQGDHGLNFYCFQQTALGKVPMQNFWWPYGPLMPYYYAGFIKLFGDSMAAVFLGRIFLYLLAGAFCYMTLSLYFHPLLAFAGAIWVWAFHPDFFYTYNHFGAIALFFASAYFLIKHIKSGRIKYIYGSLFCSFFIMLIRVNMGLAVVAGICASFVLIGLFDKSLTKKNVIQVFAAACAFGLVAAGIYLVLLKGLQPYQIQQAMPYFEKGYYASSLFERVTRYIRSIAQNFDFAKPANLAVSAFAVIAFIHVILTHKSNTDTKLKRDQLLIFIILAVLLLVSSHEYLLGTHEYRIIWMKPFHLLLLFFILGFGTDSLASGLKILAYFLLVVIAAQAILGMHAKFRRDKLPFYYLAHPKAKIYISNDPYWSETVDNTVNFLTKNMAQDESFLAVPFDAFYYYLTDKPSPVWELIFLNKNGMPPQQEEKIIQALKDKNVRWVVLSNRIFSPEVAFGKFGEDYMVRLAPYLNENYKVVAQFGDWKARPGWNNYHATRVLKRIE